MVVGPITSSLQYESANLGSLFCETLLFRHDIVCSLLLVILLLSALLPRIQPASHAATVGSLCRTRPGGPAEPTGGVIVGVSPKSQGKVTCHMF